MPGKIKTKTVLAKQKQQVQKTDDKVVPPTSKPTIVSLSEIDICPLNYRKFYSKENLEELAANIKLLGIISPPTIRKMPTGRFELVVGERRYRAAKIACLQEIPVMIRQLSDDEVRELQLVENIQREDPHPWHEAQGILQYQQTGKTVEQIATRLGKPKSFVYGRLKLATLIEPFQEMFLANVININEAVNIATLAPDSQAELFNNSCSDWKEEEEFQFHNLAHLLSRFRYDLNKAPFNPKDKKLVPEVGACTGCPFNSASLKTLFPDYAKEAVCTNKECYARKCNTQFVNGLVTAVGEHGPEGLVFHGNPSEEILQILNALPETAGLPVFNRYAVTLLDEPQEPARNEYEYEGEKEKGFDEEGYQQALSEYTIDLEEFRTLMESGAARKGLLVEQTRFTQLLFTERELAAPSESFIKVTAKEVQEAIKTKNATPELLQAEITRIRSKENRAKELDAEKLQVRIHESLLEKINPVGNNVLTAEDLAATRLIIYQSLDYAARNEVDEALFGKAKSISDDRSGQLWEALKNLSDAEHSFLIRRAIATKSDSKLPGNITGLCLRIVAEGAEVDTVGLAATQKKKADEREEKANSRIKDLEKLIGKLTKKMAA